MAGGVRRRESSGLGLAATLLGLMMVEAAGCGPGTAPGERPSATIRSGAEETGQPSDPTWTWSDERVAEFWRRVGRGRRLAPGAWPGEARVAVALSFDYQMGSIYEPNPAASTSTNSQYDGLVGLPRLLRLLDKHEVPASFFTTGITAKLYPETLRAIMASGRHEIGVHGWLHERNTEVPPDEERRLLTRAIEEIQAVSGRRPTGYRSPSWAFSDVTLHLLRELRFEYDSGMMGDEEPYEILQDGQPTGLIEVPVEWMRDDAMYYPRSGPANPLDVFDAWRLEFDLAYEEGGLFQLTMHPRISGHRSRVAMLDRLISYMKSKPGVWFATHEAVARTAAEGLKAAAAPPGP